MAARAVLLITGCKLQQDNVCQSARARRKKPKAIHQQSFVCTLLSLRTDWTRSCGDIIINQTTPGARVIWAIITFLPSAGRYIYVDSFPFCQSLLKGHGLDSWITFLLPNIIYPEINQGHWVSEQTFSSEAHGMGSSFAQWLSNPKCLKILKARRGSESGDRNFLTLRMTVVLLFFFFGFSLWNPLTMCLFKLKAESNVL